MRILFCATQPPIPPVDGHRLQLIEVARELATRHELCMLAYKPRDEDGAPPPGVELLTIDSPSRSVGSRVSAYVHGLVRGQPNRVARLADRMRDETARLVANRSFDVVHVSHGSLASVTEVLGSTPAILASRDAEYLNLAADGLVGPLPLRPLYLLEARRLRRFEATAYRPFKRLVFVSDEDAQALSALDPALPVQAIPNGVDLHRFSPDPSTEPEPGHVVFTGDMQWSPNIRAADILAREVLPLVRARRPDARLSIVGRSPREEVLELGRLDGVTVTGEVPDIRPWLWRAEVYACPMASGTGIKNKLLEALACGRACVATPLACQGMQVRDEHELLVADGPTETAEAIGRLLEDAALRERLGRAGRQYVEEHHSWAAVARAFERVYEEVVDGA